MSKLLVILALCASTTLAQQTTGTLKGQVLDELGGAIVGARVVAVNFSLNFQNLLNHTNDANPIGNLSSQLFGISTSSAGGFGGFGGLNSNAYNRRIEAQIRFTF